MSRSLRVVFLGSPPFAVPVVNGLLESGHQPVAVVTPPDRPRGRGRATKPSALVECARSAGLDVIQPDTTKDPDFVARLAAYRADVMVVASYGEFLRREMLDLCPHGALNVHASLLPRWRGASPIQRAVLAGDAETGVSIQRMVMKLDAGDILLESRTPIGADETSGDLFERLALLGGQAIVRALDQIAAGTATYAPQDAELVTLAPKLSKADGNIDWTLGTRELERFVRGMTPWPGARTRLPDGRDLVALEARAATVDGVQDRMPPGALIGDTSHRSKPQLIASTGDGALELLRVKPSGKGVMDAGAFLRGTRLKSGERLGAAPKLDG